MKVSRVHVQRLAAAALLISFVAVFAACGAFGGDQNTFSASGDVAEKQRNLFYVVLIPATIILILVSAVLVYTLVRFRRREGDAMPEQVHGNDRLEIAWTIAPALLLIGIAIPTIASIIDLGRDAKDDALHVRVVAFRWDWNFEYLDAEYAGADGEPLTTAECGAGIDEIACLYVPVDREVSLELESLDVIHSFWVPKLAGKQDVVPGRTNEMWFNATEPGIFSGQCAEFCGLGHAVMRFKVVALEVAQFDECLEALAGAAEEPEICNPELIAVSPGDAAAEG